MAKDAGKYENDTVNHTTIPCTVCKKSTKMVLPVEGYFMWLHGTLIQEAFPELSPSERELIKTGIHDECWDVIFPEKD